MATGQRLGIVAAGLATGLFAATQFIAWAFYWSPALGAGLSLSPDLTLYAPWSVLEWRTRFGAAHPHGIHPRAAHDHARRSCRRSGRPLDKPTRLANPG